MQRFSKSFVVGFDLIASHVYGSVRLAVVGQSPEGGPQGPAGAESDLHNMYMVCRTSRAKPCRPFRPATQLLLHHLPSYDFVSHRMSPASSKTPQPASFSRVTTSSPSFYTVTPLHLTVASTALGGESALHLFFGTSHSSNISTPLVMGTLASAPALTNTTYNLQAEIPHRNDYGPELQSLTHHDYASISLTKSMNIFRTGSEIIS